MSTTKRPVLVTWRDATARNNGWEPRSAAAALTPSVVQSVGYIVRRSKREIVIVQSLSDDGDAMGAFAIPRAWVKRIERL